MTNKGKIHISCSDGIKIFIDDEAIGTSSVEEKGKFIDDIESGIHILKFVKMGYATRIIEVEVRERQVSQVIIREKTKEMKISQQGEPLPVIEESLIQQTGSLKIVTFPAVCRISMLGKLFEKIKNEIIFENITAGKKNIKFIFENKELDYNVEIEDNTIKEIVVDFITEKIIISSNKEDDQIVASSEIKYSNGEDDLSELVLETIEEIVQYDSKSSIIPLSCELDSMIPNEDVVEEIVAFQDDSSEVEKYLTKTDEFVHLLLKDFPKSYNNDSSDQFGNKFFDNQIITIFITGISSESSYYTSFKLVEGDEMIRFNEKINRPDYTVEEGNISIKLKEGTYRVVMKYEKMADRRKSYVIECRIKKTVAGERVILTPNGNDEIEIVERGLLKNVG